MSQQDKKAAAAKAALAARQMRHAASNAGDAAESAAEYVRDEVIDGAVETKNSVKDLASKAIFTEAGRGVLAISIGILSIGVGVKKFQNASSSYKSLRYPKSVMDSA